MTRALVLLAVLALGTARAAAFVTAVESIGLTVSDMERSLAFYTTVLPFQKVSDVEVAGSEYEKLTGVFGCRLRIVRLRLGDELVELTEFIAPRGRRAPDDARSNDRWFQHVAIVVRDMQQAYATLRAQRVEHASTGPQRLPDWNVDAGGIEAFYFKDPDGHPLELIHFPPGKGDPRWQRETGSLFLGIDHTAIVVADTRASLRFYEGVLGLHVVGTSDNFGVEQEHLNNVEGARLHITGLRAAGGPGIELLEYRVPRTGRPYPADERANDLVHWQTRVATASVADAAAKLRAASAPFVSAGAVDVPADPEGFHRGATVRDPDGHAVQVVEP
ncbi:MAG TPA: VOC family protein [Candidatus Eisenbacteria bacterium]|nr:VOC family protein [Candidatus Eisenbacteria bacterium]